MVFVEMLIRVEERGWLGGDFQIEMYGMLRLCGDLSYVGAVRSHSAVESLIISEVARK